MNPIENDCCPTCKREIVEAFRKTLLSQPVIVAKAFARSSFRHNFEGSPIWEFDAVSARDARRYVHKPQQTPQYAILKLAWTANLTADYVEQLFDVVDDPEWNCVCRATAATLDAAARLLQKVWLLSSQAAAASRREGATGCWYDEQHDGLEEE